MHVQAISRPKLLKCLALVLSVVFLLACTSFAAHVDRAGGDDGKGHCSICLGATAHIVQPVTPVATAPQLIPSRFTATSDTLVALARYESSLYIRPPPSL
jgi:hypothetical protein